MVRLVDNCIADIIYQLGMAYILNDQASNNYNMTGGVQGAIKSESVGQHSITYQDVKQKTADELRREKNGLVNQINQMIKYYFAHTGLMYRGYYDYEHESNYYKKNSRK